MASLALRVAPSILLLSVCFVQPANATPPARTPPAQPAIEHGAEWAPIVRFGAGIAVVGPTLGVQGEAHGGVRRLHVGVPTPVFDLALEAGYVGVATNAYEWHLFSASVSPGVGVGLWAVRWAPRFLAGSTNSRLGIGVRNELILGYLRGLIELSTGHSFVRNNTDTHAFHVGVTLDLGLALYAVLGFFGSRNARPTGGRPQVTQVAEPSGATGTNP